MVRSKLRQRTKSPAAGARMDQLHLPSCTIEQLKYYQGFDPAAILWFASDQRMADSWVHIFDRAGMTNLRNLRQQGSAPGPKVLEMTRWDLAEQHRVLHRYPVQLTDLHDSSEGKRSNQKFILLVSETTPMDIPAISSALLYDLLVYVLLLRSTAVSTATRAPASVAASILWYALTQRQVRGRTAEPASPQPKRTGVENRKLAGGTRIFSVARIAGNIRGSQITLMWRYGPLDDDHFRIKIRTPGVPHGVRARVLRGC
ncbi:hypothetical protein NUW58_g601 [Xylaria curta]|uniref:Uncharacterized protein n=1 Tax=Xylaria curta TaxID=42375 RepID=A0ACC1PRN1_9PEZI|nr:hypothetical protein NUW58_g601 [Xylaria curta]